MIENIDTLESILLDCQCALFLIDISDPNGLNQIEKLFAAENELKKKLTDSDIKIIKKILSND